MSRLAHQFTERLLRNKSRIVVLVEYWLSHVFPTMFPDVEYMVSDVLRVFFTQPVQVIIEMKNVTFLQYPFPLRFLHATEVAVLYSLLQAHHQHAHQPLFQSHIGLQGFKLRYDHFKYNSYLSQRVDREAFVMAFVHLLLQLTTDRTVHNRLLDLVEEATLAHTLKEHPTQKAILQNVAALRL